VCNEIEEKLVASYCVTMCSDGDPVEVSIYPIFPEVNENDLIFGRISRETLLRAGIEIIQYEDFVADHWESPDGAIRTEYRPHIRRKLTQEEVDEIRREVEAAFPLIGSDELEY
jgi:hypothetical protein